jgi:hypothetical protein
LKLLALWSIIALPTGRESARKEKVPMIIHNKFNGRYFILEKNATAGDLIITLVRALDMVVKDIAKKKGMHPEDLMESCYQRGGL